MNQIVRILWMSRWGMASPQHGYVSIVSDSDPFTLLKKGNDEGIARGGKYSPQVHSTWVDMNYKPIKNQLSVQEPPDEVYVAIAVYKEDSLIEETWHLVGAFSNKELAREYASNKYKDWQIIIEKHKVEK